ncbi:hypothetical protein HMPREF1624_07237 [Sporothrix schenckii ATCC 58251]|uniref:Phosphatidylinositol N-acetylglucosaminyltransferase subunit H conserved domain-containing protein n=1 Tax=Sporothrix schenckii (strain ATCC 58251 / de Perez 2211183) TaxID=1391915 RepID=U7PL75_SPOS1|nr:hypothetical protein HMPREF1624_07237 [Sporothrix schenckii ATCC 58251]
MFGPPHLEVRRPSPTTIEFVVTTQPRRTGWTGWALAAAVVGMRVLLAASAGVAVWAWTNQDVVASLRRGRVGLGLGADMTWQNLVWHLFVSAHGLDALRAIAAAPPWMVLPLCVAALWASIARVHTSESLLVLRGLGIQTRSTGATYLGELASGLSVVWWMLTTPWTLVARFFSISTNDRGGAGATVADGYYGEPTPAATRFIPTEKLQDLLVNEAFRGFEVRYYLVAVVAGRGAGPLGGERLGVRVKNVRLLEESEEEEDNDYDEKRDNLRDGNSHGNSRYHSRQTRDDEDYDSDDSDNDSDGPGGGSSSEEDEDHIVVVFPRLLPGLDIVRTVWREARACLYEPDARG